VPGKRGHFNLPFELFPTTQRPQITTNLGFHAYEWKNLLRRRYQKMTSLRMSFTLVAYYGFCLGGVGVLHNKTFLYKMHAISYIVTSLPLVRYAETSGPDPQHIVNNWWQ
jgi:hypothetical protein